jgi:tripartite-type tricarboxylate transporter receptor subunit TctC
MNTISRFLKNLRSVTFLAIALTSASIYAQTDKPIRILLGFAPGGSGDAVARLLALGMQQELNRSVIVENRPGAGGQIAAQALKLAKPDGQTLFLANNHTVSMIPLTILHPGFDPVKDFMPVALITRSPDVFAINPKAMSGSAMSLKDFVAWARANPEMGNVGVPAPASAPDFAVSLISTAMSADLKSVPYRGDVLVAQDLMAGQIPAGIGSIGSMLQAAKAGKIRIVAVNGATRLPALPDVPTYAELGIPGYDTVGFTAIFAPAGTSNALVQAYSSAIAKVVASNALADKLTALGMTAAQGNPTDVEKLMHASNLGFISMVKRAGHKPQ